MPGFVEWWEWRKRNQREWRKRMVERLLIWHSEDRLADRSVGNWVLQENGYYMYCINTFMCLYVCAYICTYIYHRSHKSSSVCQICFEVLSAQLKFKLRQEKELCKKRRREGFLSLQKLLNWNKRCKQLGQMEENNKNNRDIWDSTK